jgi:hypothetical protein
MTCRYGAPGCETPHDDRDNLTDGVLCSRVVTTSPFGVVGSREASADGSGRCMAGRRRVRESITPKRRGRSARPCLSPRTPRSGRGWADGRTHRVGQPSARGGPHSSPGAPLGAPPSPAATAARTLGGAKHRERSRSAGPDDDSAAGRRGRRRRRLPRPARDDSVSGTAAEVLARPEVCAAVEAVGDAAPPPFPGRNPEGAT